MADRKQRGRGRPRCQNRMGKRVTFRLQNSTFEDLQRVASAERRNIPDFLRIVVEDRIAAQVTRQ